MSNLLVLIVSGAVSGAIYSLVAAGLTLTYSATGVFNFAYGGVAFSAAYAYYELHTAFGWPIVPAAVVTLLVLAPLVGLVLNEMVFKWLTGSSEHAKIVATVGLLVGLPAVTQWTFNRLEDTLHLGVAPSSTVLQASFPSGVVPVPISVWHPAGGVSFNSNQLAVVVAAVLCAVGMWVLVRRTPIGLRMRAVVDRRELARMRGVDDAAASRLACVLGTFLAALAGVVGAPILGIVNTGPFVTVVFIAAAASVLGGIRSIPIALAAGIALGVARNLVAGYADFASAISGFSESVPTVILLVGLVVLGRDRSRVAGSANDELATIALGHDLPTWRRAGPWLIAATLLCCFILRWSNPFWAGTIAKGLALGLVFMSFVVVTGLGGMISLAQAAFVTAAALTTGLLINRYDLPFYVAASIAIAVVVVLGLIVALPAVRLGGLSLALATLALALIGDGVLFQWDWVRNSSSGWNIPRPPLGPIHLTSNRSMAMFLLAVVLVVMVLVHNLRRSPWGRSIAAVRSSEAAAATSGVSPVRVKLVLFAISAAIAGLGGILYASVLSNVTSTTATSSTGMLWLTSAVLFGIRRPAAAVLAGVTAAAMPVILQSGFHWWGWVPTFLSWDGTKSSEIPLILFGLGAVSVARDPDGFLAANAATLHRWRQRRRSPSAAPPALVRPTPDRDARPGLWLSSLAAGYGDVVVLHGVDLLIVPGEVTALFGSNGSGKSTMCKTIAGIVVPSGGSVDLDGADITALAAHRRARRGITVVPESRGIFPGLTVDENLALRLSPAGRRAVIERFPQLAARRHLRAGSLSGGEQQMLSLAPSLVDPPRVLVVDEPTLGLAPLTSAMVLGLLRDVAAQGTAVLLVEEKAKEVLHVADRVAFIHLGNIEWQGSAAEVDERRLTDAYLGRVESELA